MPSALSSTLVGLSALGFWLLWGNMQLNGGSDAMLGTAAAGVFPDGTPVHNADRTGVWPLDFQMNVLIAFFSSASKMPAGGAPDMAPWLMLVDLTTSLLVINLMVLVESRRRSGFFMRSPAVWQYFWNCGGVAVFLPIWALLYTKQRAAGGTRPIPAGDAAALPLTAAVSFLLELPLMLPAWLGASAGEIHQGVVYFFLGPATFSAFHAAAAWLAGTFSGAGSSSRGSSIAGVKTGYWVMAAVAGATHLWVMAQAAASAMNGGGLGALARLYVPDGGAVYAAGTKQLLLTEAALLFLQWDWVVIHLTVLLLGAHLFRTGRGGGSVLGLVGWTAVFGPGVGLAYVACCEEDGLAVDGKRE
jgi:hypothetical protein